MKKTFLASILSLVILLSLGVVLVHAQTGGTGSIGGTGGTGSTNVGIKLDNPFKGGTSLFDLLKAIINDILIPIGAVLAVIGFIYAGFKYVLARGNTTKLAEAHRTLLYVAVGSIVLLGAWTISQVIQNTISKLM